MRRILSRGGERFERALPVARALERRGGELQAQRPTLGDFLQPRAQIGVGPIGETLGQQAKRLGHLEAQFGRGNPAQVAMRQQVGCLQWNRVARARGDLQVGRQVVQQVVEDLQNFRVVHPFAIVEDERCRRGALGDFREQRGQGRQRAGAAQRFERAPAQHAVALRPAQAFDDRARDQGGTVVSIQAEPARDSPRLQPVEPPLREQRGLAVPGGRLDQKDRDVIDGPNSAQPLAHQQALAELRRRDLENNPRVERGVGHGYWLSGCFARSGKRDYRERMA